MVLLVFIVSLSLLLGFFIRCPFVYLSLLLFCTVNLNVNMLERNNVNALKNAKCSNSITFQHFFRLLVWLKGGDSHFSRTSAHFLRPPIQPHHYRYILLFFVSLSLLLEFFIFCLVSWSLLPVPCA